MLWEKSKRCGDAQAMWEKSRRWREVQALWEKSRSCGDVQVLWEKSRRWRRRPGIVREVKALWGSPGVVGKSRHCVRDPGVGGDQELERRLGACQLQVLLRSPCVVGEVQALLEKSRRCLDVQASCLRHTELQKEQSKVP